MCRGEAEVRSRLAVGHAVLSAVVQVGDDGREVTVTAAEIIKKDVLLLPGIRTLWDVKYALSRTLASGVIPEACSDYP